MKGEDVKEKRAGGSGGRYYGWVAGRMEDGEVGAGGGGDREESGKEIKEQHWSWILLDCCSMEVARTLREGNWNFSLSHIPSWS